MSHISLQATRHFELMNYSEHGTTVDNVLYSCDFSDKCGLTPKNNSSAAAVRRMISKKERRRQRELMKAAVKLEPEVQRENCMTSNAYKVRLSYYKS